MIVLGLDPGPESSALVAWDGSAVRDHNLYTNDGLLAWLHSPDLVGAILVIEKVESFGMAVGASVFETVFWSGRFAEAWSPNRVDRIGRKAVKLHLCQSARATDANIRQALLDRIGPIGTKKDPGPLYGVKGHEFAALAVAVTWADQATDRLNVSHMKASAQPEF